MKWNSNKAKIPSDGNEWSTTAPASDSTESDLPTQSAQRRDHYYQVITANHESRSVTLRSLDSALLFFNALKQ